jgi:hypothetical protein
MNFDPRDIDSRDDERYGYDREHADRDGSDDDGDRDDWTYPFHDQTMTVTHCGRFCFKAAGSIPVTCLQGRTSA